MAQKEVADIVRDQGAAFKRTRRLSLPQHQALSAIEHCRCAQLGGHVLRCDDCGEINIAYNSCRNRHCPKCQGSAAKRWLDNRRAELLPVEYYHVVFTLPTRIAEVALQNPSAVYSLLFRVTAETLRTIARDPKHLGAEIGFTAVLHTWGSAMTHHPHLHCIVPGGGLTPRGRWQPCKRGFFLPVRVFSRLFRRLFLEQLTQLHSELAFHGDLAPLAERKAFDGHLDPLRHTEWVVYAKRPFAGPEAVLSQLAANEFLRRFLIHILPAGFHRIRHFGLFANHQRGRQLERLRNVLEVFEPEPITAPIEKPSRFICRTCGTPLVVIEIIDRPQRARAPP